MCMSSSARWVFLLLFAMSENASGNQDFLVLIGNDTDSTHMVIYNDESAPFQFGYTVKITPARPLQTVKIQKIDPTPLVICEAKLIEKVCETGRFGYNCSLRCPCGDGQACDPVTGECRDECDVESYGPNCSRLFEAKNDSPPDSVIIGAAVGSVVAVLVVGGILAFVLIRIRRSKRSSKPETEQPPKERKERPMDEALGHNEGQDSDYDEIHLYTGNTYTRLDIASLDNVADSRQRLQELYQRLSDIKTETSSAELELKQVQLEEEIHQAERKLNEVKKELAARNVNKP